MTKLADLLRRNLLSIFNERNGKKRKTAVKELWAKDGVLWSAEGTYVGHRAIEQAAAIVLRDTQSTISRPQEKSDEIPDAARMRWSLGAVGIPPAITGMDIVIASDGQITAIYRFVDGAEL